MIRALERIGPEDPAEFGDEIVRAVVVTISIDADATEAGADQLLDHSPRGLSP